MGNLDEITGLTPIVYVRAPVINRKNKCEQVPPNFDPYVCSEFNSLVKIKITLSHMNSFNISKISEVSKDGF